MEIEKDSVKLSLSNDLIKEAHIHSMKAHNHDHQYYVVTSKKLEVLFIGFKGSMEVHDFYLNDSFGETEVDCNLFPSLQRIAEGRLAKVNQSVLQKFQNLLIHSEFKSEVEAGVKKNRKILFTGHSTGGAIASLATLWMLDEYTRKRKVRLPIGCVTFGSPLIGDGTLTHAVRRQKWAGHFTHFVMEHDIVPRIMLAPKSSIQQHLPDVLKSLQQKLITPQKTNKLSKIFSKKTTENDDDQTMDGKQAGEFIENVLIKASTVASHDAYDLMEPTNSLKDKLSADFVKVSPYRPFGEFVFCTRGEHSTTGQLLVVENPSAVLQLLFYFLQVPNEDQDLAQFGVQCLTENFGYEGELNNNGLQLDNMVHMKDLNKHLLASNGSTDDAIIRTRNKALFELTASAKWCLLAAEEAEKRKEKNMDQIKKSMRNDKSNKSESSTKNVKDMLDEILEYKKKHSGGNIDYYEAFKLQKEHEDFKANVNRLEQAKIWDEIVEMVMRRDLPDEFEVMDDLIDLGTRFRRIYEPLDIANYYRHSKGDGYLAVRPKRYKFTQRWYEHANVTCFELVSESNFVAEVEETVKSNNETRDKVEEYLKSIKDRIDEWKSDKKVANEDVYWGDSVLAKLQEKLIEVN